MRFGFDEPGDHPVECDDPVAGVGGNVDTHARHQVQGLLGELPGAVEELHEARGEAQDLGWVTHPWHNDGERVAAGA